VQYSRRPEKRRTTYGSAYCCLLFGSVKGSMHSEGFGPRQDDKRAYYGEIREEISLRTSNDDGLLLTLATACDNGPRE